VSNELCQLLQPAVVRVAVDDELVLQQARRRRRKDRSSFTLAMAWRFEARQ